jgi:hypothetical protein
MTEVELELQSLRREVERLTRENIKLKADNDSLESLHQLDTSEIFWLRRLCETYMERRAAADG